MAVEGVYNHLLDSISSNIHGDDPEALTALARSAISNAEATTKSHADNRRMQWEYLIKRDIFNHAMLEGKALASGETEPYYSRLKEWLDLALVFTELGATDPSYTFSVIQDLLETQTIPSCSRIFDWIELRSRPSHSGQGGRLTHGMVPQKGKALVLLRTLNDLLRRLSKAGRETIGFSGRILTFLSQVFPLGERSGVNLRGEYGPTWDMPVDDSRDKNDFYHVFWSLQLPFSKPSVFPLQMMTFAQFQDAVDKVLPVIKEATAKERAMMGAGRSAGASTAPPSLGTPGLKRKREEPDESIANSTSEYFFAKFLTSPELLDLEIADTHFRRQFLLQLLILLTHLLNFTKAGKTWQVPRNRSLHMPLCSGSEWTLDDALILDKAVTSTGSTNEKAKAQEKDPKDAANSDSPSSPFNPPTSSTNPGSASNTSDSHERLDPIRWTNLTISRTIEEIRQTQPPPIALSSAAGINHLTGPSGLSGRHFAETAQVMLEREKGWVKWKNELCDAKVFEKGRWEASDELLKSLEALEGKMDQDNADLFTEDQRKKRKMTMSMYEATRPLRTRHDSQSDGEWKWDLGTEALTEIWAMGYRSLDDLENVLSLSPGDPRDFLRQIQLEDKKIDMRTRTLRAQQERRMQVERAAKEKMEQAQREATDKEAKMSPEVTVANAESGAKEANVESVKAEQDQDVEMKPQAEPQAKIEPIPVLQVHQLPPKPGSSPRPPSPLKVEQVPQAVVDTPTPAVSSTDSTSAQSSSISTAAAGPSTEAPAAPELPSLPPDEHIRKAEESKTRISWLALRAARDSTKGQLVHFSKIGTGDVRLLVEEIEKTEVKEREEKEKMILDRSEEKTKRMGEKPDVTDQVDKRLKSESKEQDEDVKME